MIDVNLAILATIPLFIIGFYGVLARRHFIRIIISFEIALTAVILAIGAFATSKGMLGEVIGIIIIAVVAMEVALGLAIAIQLDRLFQTVDIYELRKLKEE
jgi:NADH:ubiquinone oxidoreductase subunit 11 or 4L (chain K)